MKTNERKSGTDQTDNRRNDKAGKANSGSKANRNNQRKSAAGKNNTKSS